MNPHRFLFLFLALGLSFVHASNLQRGQEIYSQICVTCHGPNLDGGIGPSLVDAYWKHGDTSEAIMRSISKGIVGTEMIAYEYVYSEEDRQAVTDFILDRQEGNRQTLRSFLRPGLFQRQTINSPSCLIRWSRTRKESCQKIFSTPNEHSTELLRGQSKLYIKQAGKYRL